MGKVKEYVSFGLKRSPVLPDCQYRRQSVSQKMEGVLSEEQ